MNMQASPWLYAFLRNYERFRPTAYKPTPHDVWTIGFGHTHGVKEGDTCTMVQALGWLGEDVAWAVAAVNHQVKVTINQNQFDALVSLCFNIGATNFASSGLLRYVNTSHFA